jgi:hypothetical protein
MGRYGQFIQHYLGFVTYSHSLPLGTPFCFVLYATQNRPCRNDERSRMACIPARVPIDP